MSSEPVVIAQARRFELLKGCEWPKCPEVAVKVGQYGHGKYCEPHTVRQRFSSALGDRVYELLIQFPRGSGWCVDAANYLAYEEARTWSYPGELTEEGQKTLWAARLRAGEAMEAMKEKLQKVPEGARWLAERKRTP